MSDLHEAAESLRATIAERERASAWMDPAARLIVALVQLAWCVVLGAAAGRVLAWW